MCVCVCVCVFIYIYDGCPLGFDPDHLLYLMSSPLPLLPPLNCMCSLVTIQASQTATDFVTELAQLITFVCSDIIWVQDRFAHVRRWLWKPAIYIYIYIYIRGDDKRFKSVLERETSNRDAI